MTYSLFPMQFFLADFLKEKIVYDTKQRRFKREKKQTKQTTI